MSTTANPPPQAGEPARQAVAKLVELHGGRIRSLGLRFCGDPDQADDLVQETFLNAFRKWDQFQGDADPATWLYTIAARVCQRMHRKRAGEPDHILSIDASLPATGPVPDLPDLNENDPASIQIRREAQGQLEAAIASLPANYRMALVLKDIIGLSIDDIAGVLDLKPATVKTRVHRARLIVRDMLQSALPTRDAPPPAYSKQVCMDLLEAKQASLDHGAPFPLPPGEFCQRCKAVFASMDLAKDLCQRLDEGQLPAPLRDLVMKKIQP